ncbi:o-succinylbenzoate synthase [Echinimonas agarilytica]|uniref:o-succinylbenzoate synthase n=1 Tax=Echinimonas agarilytica TaxID=1215918 RepID=A0AA42B8D7_9GAMM|nr:o-succinylbenzoate synthase [Echinimonas agarilytica]MCM2681100.1 o-succinylbenzoate synthase [Echinimonas agarilytica]
MASSTEQPHIIAAYRYRLPFVKPLTLAHGVHTHRQGLLIAAQCQLRQTIIWGEAAPLPGFSRETLADVEAEFLQWINSCNRDSIGLSSASLQFALSMLSAPTTTQTGVIQSAQLVTAGMTKTALNPNEYTIKLKLGHQTIAGDIQQFRQFAEQYPNARFRLDVNQAWQLEQAQQFAQGINLSRVEWFEEPCKQLAMTQAFARSLPVPIALDEHLQQPDYEPELFEGLVALVCKPTLIGTLQTCKKLHAFTQHHDLDFVVSSSFESNIGHQYLQQLAQLWQPNTRHGLDTLKALASDAVFPRSSTSNLPVVPTSHMALVWQL